MAPLSARFRLIPWLNQRFPVTKLISRNFTHYYAPKNLNFWYFFGSLALFVLLNQLITGIWLTMHYTPTGSDAFASIEFMMREIKFGWLIRYLHSTGASAFFIVIYLHLFRSLLYGSYKQPRELLWLIGMSLFLLLFAEAFTGYLLPWGQMSYWAAQVITSLIGAIPWIGEEITLWLRGDYHVSEITLHRFFALHIIAIPLFLLPLVFLHLFTLHYVGSNNPQGIEIKKTKKAIKSQLVPLHPYYTVKDFAGLILFLIIFCGVVFFAPQMGGYFLEPSNFVPANPLVTPEHIFPLWYMAPFYSILRAIPSKLFGGLAMASAIALLFVLPWLDRSPVKSMHYRGLSSKIGLALYTLSFIGLGVLGTLTITPMRQLLAQLFSFIYFAVLLLMPFYTRLEKTKPVPTRIR